MQELAAWIGVAMACNGTKHVTSLALGLTYRSCSSPAPPRHKLKRNMQGSKYHARKFYYILGQRALFPGFRRRSLVTMDMFASILYGTNDR